MKHHQRVHKSTPAIQCLVKISHKSEAAAWAHARRVPDCVPYRCPHCRRWHIGHLIGWVLKRTYQR